MRKSFQKPTTRPENESLSLFFAVKAHIRRFPWVVTSANNSRFSAVPCARFGKFLAGCEYVSDIKLFDEDDYWQPPEEFEKRKKGDCEDFALWTWRQLLNMGYDARFIGGSCGRYGEGHGWVEYCQDGKWFLVEPLRCRIGDAMPRLSTWRYEPKLSVSWDGKTLRYFSHKKPESRLGWLILAPLVSEYVLFWTWFWLRNFYRLPQIAWGILRRALFHREHWLRPRRRER